MFLETGDVELTDKHLSRLSTIRDVFGQQKYMYKMGMHSVKDRIVCISQPYIRPIARGKAKTPVEFGAKLDMSIDENRIVRLERISFDAYNEADVLINAIENYQQRIGYYPERVLVDQIYRNRANRAYCKEHGIRISGTALGRPKKMTAEEREQAYGDNIDWIGVERGFGLAKDATGLDLYEPDLIPQHAVPLHYRPLQ